MLIVKLCGGLGNQMYQYAFGLKLKRLFPKCTIKKDTRDYRLTKYHYGYEIGKIFKKITCLEEAGWKEVKEIRGELPVILSGKAAKITEPVRSRINNTFFVLKDENILDEGQVDGYQLLKKYGPLLSEKDFYLQGFWSDINYYLDDMDMLTSEFVFSEFPDRRNRELQEEMNTVDSVSVHIRRGDYVNSSFDVTTLEYYRRAIAYIESSVDMPRFYFFSDDVGYVEKHFENIRNKTVIDWNRGHESWRDMQLMSCCKHNIIANSTFSQWGALLNQNHNKLVIYPDKKAVNLDMEYIRLPGWHKVEV